MTKIWGGAKLTATGGEFASRICRSAADVRIGAVTDGGLQANCSGIGDAILASKLRHMLQRIFEMRNGGAVRAGVAENLM
ncbi:MAG: hypothetical protein JO320_00335 [Alphaproteobacteria bacterium]|nr:hypothetical protein [Alphaproteobacteria bacterium]